MKNNITVQLKKNEIYIKIKEDAQENEIIEELKEKVAELKKLYKDDTTPIKITGKILKNKQMEEIQKLIEEQINVKIQFETPKTLGLARNNKSI